MPIIHDDDFRAWETGAPESLRGDPVWRFHTYRVSLFLLDRAGRDAHDLQRHRAFPYQTDQLLRAVASISANIAEGLGRTSSAERLRFFGIALGSLRESMTWYQAVSSALPPELFALRDAQLTELRKLLIGAQKWLSSKPPRTQLM
ncbi:MAG: four helix bundle protein [Gemmatimonadaceae bacterium]